VTLKGLVATAQSLAAAKAAEAKALLGAIGRAGASAYERETYLAGQQQPSHVFCQTARPVPTDFSQVQGRKYIPSTEDGKDFNTGSNLVGWKCLKIALSDGIYYQYQYRQGGGYLVPSVSPGPNGFEVSARGEKTFVLTGRANGNGGVTLSQVYVVE
jgi:type IV pilus assembly protein PilA